MQPPKRVLDWGPCVAPRRGALRVLLVDDRPSVRADVRALIESIPGAVVLADPDETPALPHEATLKAGLDELEQPDGSGVAMESERPAGIPSWGLAACYLLIALGLTLSLRQVLGT